MHLVRRDAGECVHETFRPLVGVRSLLAVGEGIVALGAVGRRDGSSMRADLFKGLETGLRRQSLQRECECQPESTEEKRRLTWSGRCPALTSS